MREAPKLWERKPAAPVQIKLSSGPNKRNQTFYSDVSDSADSVEEKTPAIPLKSKAQPILIEKEEKTDREFIRAIGPEELEVLEPSSSESLEDQEKPIPKTEDLELKKLEDLILASKSREVDSVRPIYERREDFGASAGCQAQVVSNKSRLRKEGAKLISNPTKDDHFSEDDEEFPEDLPDDNDDLDPEAEELAWRVRELERIKRDLEERAAPQRQKEAAAKREALGEEMRVKLDAETGRNAKDFKSDVKYLQKYTKSFTFFQDSEDPLFKRDYNVPVGLDTFDKSALPQAMQARGEDFFKKGRSKYKDLMTEDTNVYRHELGPDPLIMKKFKDLQMGGKRAKIN